MGRQVFSVCFCLAAFASGAVRADAPPSAVAQFIAAARAMEAEGRGNAAAAAAWKALLEQASAAAIPDLLAAIDERRHAANWLRAAVDALAERALEGRQALPLGSLRAFVLDARRDPQARRLAYEWLARAAPKDAEALVPGLLDDPSLELRRDAVAGVLAEAAALPDERRAEALALWQKALRFARDLDQVEEAAKRLRDAGEAVDLARHFGFLQEWKLLGPFPNPDERGFDAVYAPESAIDLGAEHDGDGAKVRWIDHRTTDEFGRIDLNRAVAHRKDVLAYALHDFESAAPRDVEFRIASVNAFKLWLDGKPLFARNEYHHGTQLDHYRVPARLEAGRNRILLKVCQNGLKEPYADVWRFQIRVCDAAGTAVLAEGRGASHTKEPTKENRTP